MTRLVNVSCLVNPPGSQIDMFMLLLFSIKKKSFWYGYRRLKTIMSLHSGRVCL
jgi:hypothetical protein